MSKLNNSTKIFKLNTGASIPALGLGTWKATNPSEATESVYLAIKHGYRHIDTAYLYLNEVEVGLGIKKAIDEGIVKREELFVTTKLWCFDHDQPLTALKGSIERLGLDYIDLYLIHWPFPFHKVKNDEGNLIYYPTPDEPKSQNLFRKDWDFFKTWELMEEIPATGLTKAIGVSNFNAGRLKALCEKAKIIPAVNQVQLHPLLPEIELLKTANHFGVLLEAYSPLGSSNAPVLSNETINAIATKNQIPAPNVIFSWIISRGIVVLAKSVKEERIISNLKVADLPKEDLDTLTNYADNHGGPNRVPILDWLPEGFWDEYSDY